MYATRIISRTFFPRSIDSGSVTWLLPSFRFLCCFHNSALDFILVTSKHCQLCGENNFTINVHTSFNDGGFHAWKGNDWHDAKLISDQYIADGINS